MTEGKADSPASGVEIPSSRYVLREDGKGRYLTCLDAQNVAVRMERGLSVSGSEARHHPKGTIFLDGVAREEPFIDANRGVYNLDHHQGCVRAFTLAACEQAMVMIRKGLDLLGNEWNIWANEPDLDTLIAIWVLLNHASINKNENVRMKIMPLVRLEGAIDAHGLDLVDLCGFPTKLLNEQNEILERLREREVSIKQRGEWDSTDPLEYSAGALRAIDDLVYPPDYANRGPILEELEHVSIGRDRMALVCRSASGIYEVEQIVNRRYGHRVALIALQKSPAAYTLRQVDSFLPVSMSSLYERLNSMDPAVRRNSRWGGSDEIGGSPRATGTGLDQQEIARIIEWVYRPNPNAKRGVSAVVSYLPAAACLFLALMGSWLLSPDVGSYSIGMLASGQWFAPILAFTGLGFLILRGFRRRHLYGLAMPRGIGWLGFIPLGLAGGIGWRFILSADVTPAYLMFLALSLEALFRGSAHGMLARRYRFQHVGGRWFVSAPNLAAAVGSAAVAAGLSAVVSEVSLLSVGGLGALILDIMLAFTLGLICGMAKERSGSLIPAVAVHTTAAAVAVFM